MTVTISAATSSDANPSDSTQRPTDPLHFPTGLIGCTDWKRFVLVTDEEATLPLAYLQSLDDPNVALVLTIPSKIDPSYVAPLSVEDRAELGLDDETQPLVYCTLTVGRDGWLTANLLGPLVVNPVTHTGKQLVLADSGYSTKFPVAQLVQEQAA